MKKIVSILIVGVFVFSSVCFAADWSLMIKDTRQDGETLFVTTEYKNDKGAVVETVDVPLFQPKTYDEVLVGLKNRAETIKSREAAKALISSKVKPDTDKEKNKPIATLTAVVG